MQANRFPRCKGTLERAGVSMVGAGPMVFIVSETKPSDTELVVVRGTVSGKEPDNIWRESEYVGIE